MKLNFYFGNISLKNEDAYLFLASLNQRILRLSQLQDQIHIDKNLEKAMENLKPRIFWRDKGIFLRQIKKWNQKKLKIAIEIVNETEIGIKTKFNNYSSIIIKNLLLKIFNLANSTF